MKINYYKLASLSLLLPSFVFAVDFQLAGSNFKSVIYYIVDVLDVLLPILFTLAFIVFFWGLSKFILSSDKEADIQKGKQYMIWGVLALFILVSFRAITGLISSELDFGNAIDLPYLKTNTPAGQINVPRQPGGLVD